MNYKQPPLIDYDTKTDIKVRIPSRYRQLILNLGRGNLSNGMHVLLFNNESKMLDLAEKLQKTDKNHDKNPKQTVKKKSK